MNRRILYTIAFIIISPVLFSQTGGDNSYEFLNLTHSSLVSSLGGSNVSLSGEDPNMAYHNPSLLDSTMNNSLALNYVNYFAGINYGFVMYAKSIRNNSAIAAGLTYLNYGSFTGADPSGSITGTFRASEYAFSFVYSRSIDSLFSFGADFKPVISHLEDYTSIGFASDFGASWHNKTNLTSTGVVIRNAGYQVTTYAGEKRENLPFEIEAGITQKLAHAPFRFSLTLRHLEKYDLTTEYIPTDPNSTSEIKGKSGLAEIGENVLRHAVFGVELTPTKNFYVSAGYNYQRRQELRIDSRVSAVGFSWGFGIKTNSVTIGFGRAMYHLAGASNHFSIVIYPDQLYNRSGK